MTYCKGWSTKTYATKFHNFIKYRPTFTNSFIGKLINKSIVKLTLKISPHLKRVATLPCEYWHIEVDSNISHGSVASWLCCDGTFSDYSVRKFISQRSVKRFRKSDNIWCSSDKTFWPPCIFVVIGCLLHVLCRSIAMSTTRGSLRVICGGQTTIIEWMLNSRWQHRSFVRHQEVSMSTPAVSPRPPRPSSAVALAAAAHPEPTADAAKQWQRSNHALLAGEFRE